MLLSIVGQVYNEEEMLPIFYDEVCKVMADVKNVDFELIFVNDFSKDKSLSIIKEIASKDSRVKCISTAKNCGKAACCLAGLSYAEGDYIVTTDVDMQDPPALLPKMIEMLRADVNTDIIAAKAVTKNDYGFIHKALVKKFYNIFNTLTPLKLQNGQRDYRMMRRCVVEEILKHSEQCLFDKGYFTDIGFNTAWLEFENVERVAGETKWSIMRLLKYSMQGIISYSIKPLYIPLYMAAVSMIGGVGVLIAAIICGVCDVVVSTGLLVGIGIGLLLYGLLFVMIGIQSVYIAQIHIETKARPRYVIRELINFDEGKNDYR